jgi:hypothetical protein
MYILDSTNIRGYIFTHAFVDSYIKSAISSKGMFFLSIFTDKIKILIICDGSETTMPKTDGMV